MLPENIQKLFKLGQDSHNYNTRHSVKGNFEVKFCRTRARSMSLSIKCVILWNNLDFSYHSINNLNLLKKNIKTMYIDSNLRCKQIIE